jgi:hypothetical protein
MIISVKSGSALAAAAATLLIAGAVAVPKSQAATEGVGHCMGANACKGQSACKGKGFVEMTKAECEKISGAVFQALDEQIKPKT